ncbi:MAG TPA: ABC transporter ATP-binding protein [Flavilitoribacter sp.]|nr:ABC transporter ATP-binding protein [Flavilitoribacter sp.]
MHEWQYRGRISYLPQIARFPENLTVSELLHMIRDVRQQPSHEQEIIRMFELEPFIKSRLGTLSGGTRQKVNLVLTFMYDSPVIILDEPTAGLDPVALIALKELIHAERKNGKVILITTHVMSFVEELADEVVFLLDGRIRFKGSVNALKSRCGEDNLERAIARLLKGECIPDDNLSGADGQGSAFPKTAGSGLKSQHHV